MLLRDKLKNLKIELKKLAKDIKLGKHFRKPKNRKDTFYEDFKSCHHGLFSNQLNFRYKHIIYCMLRGRKYSEIEQPRQCNKLSNHLFERIWRNLGLPVISGMYETEFMDFVEKGCEDIITEDIITKEKNDER